MVSEEKTITDNIWMSRCFDLARRGIGHVSPNPPVGAALVYQNRILSEGFHAHYGGPHAEVEAVNNVPAAERHLIPLSTLYVSLEPCCITGKTPPCTDLIIREGIRDVRISTWDPNPAVSGTGLDRLREKGIKVTAGILESEGRELIRPFTTNIVMHRPYILLKWAQSRFGYAGTNGEQVWLSEPDTKVWSHGQRANVDAILVGARTIETDNPSLTVRDFPGRSPHRVIYDPSGRLDAHYHVFDDDGQSIFYFSKTTNPHLKGSNVNKYLLSPDEDDFQQILKVLFENRIGILLIEGGPTLQKKIIANDMWDEAWVIQTQHNLAKGIAAPDVMGRLITKLSVGSDRVVGIRRIG